VATDDELLARLNDEEDALVERKATAERRLVRDAVCAFANSVRAPATGVLFLGVDTKGKATGKIGDPDKLCREIPGWLSRCYPLIGGVEVHALRVDGKHVVAVVVPESRDRPHFTGPAFIRDGSQTREASKEQFERLIEDRNDLVWALRPLLGERIALVREVIDQFRQRVFDPPRIDVVLQGVNQHFVTVQQEDDDPEAFSLKRVYLEEHYHSDGRIYPQLRVHLA